MADWQITEAELDELCRRVRGGVDPEGALREIEISMGDDAYTREKLVEIRTALDSLSRPRKANRLGVENLNYEVAAGLQKLRMRLRHLKGDGA